MHNKDNIFPFSAVQGQPLFKLALLLATVNPLIGGVLISGPRGSAKSTLARGVADLLPVKADLIPPFVTLPLGASEEMLIGTLDLEHVLNDKQLKFSEGLLKKAHGGVLYVDEVNLLPDHLVDQLLDVASSGINIVERDGISHSHDASFTLIGTMNPDEGELRPQLQDRFGLMVELDNIYSIKERISIIKTRQAFESNKGAFCDSLQVEQILLQQQISDAQKLLASVTCDEECFVDIATRCQQANVDGLRADIMMHRASITHAAWCGRNEVSLEDIEQVAPLVLLHRKQAGSRGDEARPPSSKSSSEDLTSKNNSEFSRPQSPATNPSKGQSNQDTEHSDETKSEKSSAGEWGAMPATSGESQKTHVSPNIEIVKLHNNSLAKKFIATEFNHDLNKGSKGTACKGDKKSTLHSNKADWFNTLISNLGQWPPKQFSFKKVTTGEQKLHLILLDTSASTLADNLSAMAKSVVKNITDSAYLQRDKISLLGFGNDNVETIIKAGRAPKQVSYLLDNINALGGTPLRLVLQKAAHSIKQMSLQHPGLSLFCYLITDGRTRVDLTDLKLSVPTLLIDIEKAQIKRGRGKSLASQLDAHYIALQG